MKRAVYAQPRQQRSRLDYLADRAPRRFRNQAGAAALAADKMVTAAMRARTAAGGAALRVRRRPAPYILMGLAVAGVAALAYGPSRRAIGSAAGKVGRTSLGAFARQLGRELRSFIK